MPPHESPDPALLTRLYDFAALLLAAPDFSHAAKLFRNQLGFFGIEGYACGEIDLLDPSRTVMLHAEWPPDWLDFYLAEGLVESDPLFERLRGARRAFTWDETWNDLAGGATRWRQAVTSFGWRSGLAVPLPRGDDRRVGLISLTSMREPLSGSENAMLATLAGLFYERARGLAAGRQAPVLPPLTAREIACLEQVAAGRDDAAIAAKIGIAPSTAHEHVERAKRKLKARTRAQAVALAVGAGIVHP